ncbi:unnamed protein product [Rotaria magnacalcarata]|uniref:Uncharacterized protein n=2 Tax=Rotaria magnacalcarata TaxID=392030 RepID=A0A815FMX5_9BILA|nr:unnamed protein product [Rotaria magnacalcarata]
MLINLQPPLRKQQQQQHSSQAVNNNNENSSKVMYPRLTSIDFYNAHIDYVEEFLHEDNAHLLSLIYPHIKYEQLVFYKKKEAFERPVRRGREKPNQHSNFELHK